MDPEKADLEHMDKAALVEVEGTVDLVELEDTADLAAMVDTAEMVVGDMVYKGEVVD